MAEQCIVCLGDLRDQLATDNTAVAVAVAAAAAEPDLPAEARAHAHAHAGDDGDKQQLLAKSLLRNTTLTTKRYRHHLLIISPGYSLLLRT
jgi:hypothetical protein